MGKFLILILLFLTTGCNIIVSSKDNPKEEGPKVVTPNSPAPTFSFTLNENISGTIQGLPSDLSTITAGTVLNLTLNIPSGYRLDHWTGACAGSTTSCQVIVTENINVGVILSQIPFYSISVTQPTLGGTISVSPSTSVYLENTSVNLSLNITSGFQLKNWTGDCSSSSTNSCTLTMTKNMVVSAEFECESGKQLVGSSCVIIPSIPVATAQKLRRVGNVGFTHIEKYVEFNNKIYIIGRVDNSNPQDPSNKDKNDLYVLNFSTDLAKKITTQEKIRDIFVYDNSLFLISSTSSLVPDGHLVFKMNSSEQITRFKDSSNLDVNFRNYKIVNNQLIAIIDFKLKKVNNNTLTEVLRPNLSSFNNISEIGVSDGNNLFISELNTGDTSTIYKLESSGLTTAYCSGNLNLEELPNVFTEIPGHSDKILFHKNKRIYAPGYSYDNITYSKLCESGTQEVNSLGSHTIGNFIATNSDLYFTSSGAAVTLYNFSSKTSSSLSNSQNNLVINSGPLVRISNKIYLVGNFSGTNDSLRVLTHDVGSSANTVTALYSSQTLDTNSISQINGNLYYFEKSGNTRTLVKDDLSSKTVISTNTYNSPYGSSNNFSVKKGSDHYFFTAVYPRVVKVIKIDSSNNFSTISGNVGLSFYRKNKDNDIILFPVNFDDQKATFISDSGIQRFSIDNRGNMIFPVPTFANISTDTEYSSQFQVINNNAYFLGRTNANYNFTLFKSNTTEYYPKQILVEAEDENFSTILASSSDGSSLIVKSDNGAFIKTGNDLVLLKNYYGDPISIDYDSEIIIKKTNNFLYFFNKKDQTLYGFDNNGNPAGGYGQIKDVAVVGNRIYYVAPYEFNEYGPDDGENPPMIINTYNYTALFSINENGYQDLNFCGQSMMVGDYCWPTNVGVEFFHVKPDVSYLKISVDTSGDYLYRLNSNYSDTISGYSEQQKHFSNVVGINNNEAFLSYDNSGSLILNTFVPGQGIAQNYNYANDSFNVFYRLYNQGNMSSPIEINFSSMKISHIAQNPNSQAACSLYPGFNEACIFLTLKGEYVESTISFKAENYQLTPIYDKISTVTYNSASNDNTMPTIINSLNNKNINNLGDLLFSAKYYDDNYILVDNLLTLSSNSPEAVGVELPNFLNENSQVIASGNVFYTFDYNQPPLRLIDSTLTPQVLLNNNINTKYVGSLGTFEAISYIDTNDNIKKSVKLKEGNISAIVNSDSDILEEICNDEVVMFSAFSINTFILNAKVQGSNNCKSYRWNDLSGLAEVYSVNGEEVNEVVKIKNSNNIFIRQNSGNYYFNTQTSSLVKIIIDSSYLIEEITQSGNFLYFKANKDGRQTFFSLSLP